MRLEDIKEGVAVHGLLPDQVVTVVMAESFGDNAVSVVYRTQAGNFGTELLYREAEERLRIRQPGPSNATGAFDGDGHLFRLVMEAKRIQNAHLFDPLLAVGTSNIEPLPHQITAVYQHMLPKHPIRFLLADDPGAGKTIMTGLLIKELIMRGDLTRCLVVCPGNLAEQWRSEMLYRFDLNFQVFSKDAYHNIAAQTEYGEVHLCIARLDHLARNADLQELLLPPGVWWDLVVCDEAHKMSAYYASAKIHYTKRYRLGQKLSQLTRNMLLLSATPHNGNDSSFRLFMALLDPDRFEGGAPDNSQTGDLSDIMRRTSKEDLRNFDGTPLFPMRHAHTITYNLSIQEHNLYQSVTDYVRTEFNRAEAIGSGKRSGTVGFALTVLQRRLASSPEAIYCSLQRRRQRLESRLKTWKDMASPQEDSNLRAAEFAMLDTEYPDAIDDIPAAEFEHAETEITDAATAAQTSSELRAEILTLSKLEHMALLAKQCNADTKWSELAKLLAELFANEAWFDFFKKETGSQSPNAPDYVIRKLVIFTEHRDTLRYLCENIASALGDSEKVIAIHGGVSRTERIRLQNRFRDDPKVMILVATDAAGEGINLQCAHLMVNYDLPWNPNRLEQRFGRIHRIGQQRECHLWNLVAGNTIEGRIYETLLDKLQRAKEQLGDCVFNVLGKLHFDGRPLRELLLDAIRVGYHSQSQRHLADSVGQAFDHKSIHELLHQEALAYTRMEPSELNIIQSHVDRSDARRLQPHYVESFFVEAVTELGGEITAREGNAYHLTSPPPHILDGHSRSLRDAWTGPQPRMITFHKQDEAKRLPPGTDYICHGHPLLSAVADEVSHKHSYVLNTGAILVDEQDSGTDGRLLLCCEYAIFDETTKALEHQPPIARHIAFLEMSSDGEVRTVGLAPYLDYRPLDPQHEPTPADIFLIPSLNWIKPDIGHHALLHVIQQLIPDELAKLSDARRPTLEIIERAVRRRLTKETAYWDRRAAELLEPKANHNGPSSQAALDARAHADRIQRKLHARLKRLEHQQILYAKPPVIFAHAIVIPAGLIKSLDFGGSSSQSQVRDTQASATRARRIIMDVERRLGFRPVDREYDKLGYDIESMDPKSGRLRFIEVKGRHSGAATITVTKNEIQYSLNNPENYILAIVEFHDGTSHTVHYVRSPFRREPDFIAASVNYSFKELLVHAAEPT